jgi:hypothetical protein
MTINSQLNKLDVFNDAAAAVSVIDMAASLGIELKLGIQRSPFREDKKPSFEVRHEGQAFVDYSTGDKGGSVKFLMVARPDWSKAKRNAHLIELAGMRDVYKGAKGPSRTKVREVRRQKRVKAFTDAEKAYVIKPHDDPTPNWSEEIFNNYMEGSAWLESNDECLLHIAEARGWPMGWVRELAEVGKLAYAKERWQPYKRQVAFVVERPNRLSMKLNAVGYHQVFYHIDSGAKSWMFHPYAKRDRVSCKAYPFVLGSLDTAAVIVIHEGQWDAATWWGAAGFFGDAPLGDYGICSFGLRGAKSTDLFLSVYGEWLRIHRPKVWLWNDNDAAGEGFHKTTVADNGQPIPSLTDRLYRLGVPLVVNSCFDLPGIKDFNDAYKAAPQSFGPDQIYELMQNENLLD